MKEDNLQELTKELRNITVSLPLHQKALRAHLLAMYTRPHSPWAGETRLLPAAKTLPRRKQFGITVLLLSALILGGFILRPTVVENSAQQLALVAAYRVRHMKPEKLTLVSKNYKALDKCMQEALRSKSLHVATNAEVHALVRPEFDKEYPSAEDYLVFVNEDGHRIIIGLDAAHAPLYAVDVDKAETGER